MHAMKFGTVRQIDSLNLGAKLLLTSKQGGLELNILCFYVVINNVVINTEEFAFL